MSVIFSSTFYMCLFFIFGNAIKLRLCIVDGKGTFKKSQKYCSKLDQPNSRVECIVCVDRLDCLRRISKGSADFGTFTTEDLVTAENAGIDSVLVTNELRFSNDSFEYQLVAVVNNHANIKSKHDLKGSKYCHPGYAFDIDSTRILSNFLEASVVTPSCDESITLTENRVKASAYFFGPTCKAGPWVNNPELNIYLKKKYSQLCEICGDSSSCSKNDKYWGRYGALFCLTDGIGDVSWARLVDVQQHFGLAGDEGESEPDNYSFLCPTDKIVPVNTTSPCTWVEKPWPVVGSRRAVAQDVQELITFRDEKPGSWKYYLRFLLDTTYTDFVKIEPIIPIESYLYKANGFLSANSFSSCHPPRTIWICTTSIKETAKCQWLKESATAYGIEPSLECIKADNTTHCMEAVASNVADIVVVPADMTSQAVRRFGLKTLFYETVGDDDKYVTVAVTKNGVEMSTWKELRGKKACFPVHDGVAWNTVKHHLLKNKLIKYCPLENEMFDFFGPSCVPNMASNSSKHMGELCQNGNVRGDISALDCLMANTGDVAFVSLNSISHYLLQNKTHSSGRNLLRNDFKIQCFPPSDLKHCYLSWTTIGRAMVRQNVSDLWGKDTTDVFILLSNLFGKNHKTTTVPFTLFGPYDGESDLLFHDVTRNFREVPYDKDINKMPREYGEFLKTDYTKCSQPSNTISYIHHSNLLLLQLILTTLLIVV